LKRLDLSKQDIGHITDAETDWKWEMDDMPAIEDAVKNSEGEIRTDAPVEIVFRELGIGEDRAAFRMLNEEWISRYFVLEPKDIETLGDPETMILRKGGFFWRMLRARRLGVWR
jgi:hypothetical protein